MSNVWQIRIRPWGLENPLQTETENLVRSTPCSQKSQSQSSREDHEGKVRDKEEDWRNGDERERQAEPRCRVVDDVR